MLERSSPYQLIHTKFNRPPLDGRWKARPRLIRQMDENAAKRLTLISAPAGYGKTTLAVQWVAQDRRSTAWLSVDPTDNDPERFIRYLASAIGAVIPDFGADVASLLTSHTMAPPEYMADTMISDLSMIDSPLSIVIDDYHNINAESIQTIMIRMIQYLPANLHLMILTRVDPPWPLGIFRVREWLGELRAADLRFSLDETRIFLNPDLKKTVPNTVVNALHGKTEGWIAGLQLARLSMVHAENPEAFARDFSSNDRLIVDFLMKEVISRQPPEIRDFLAVTAILDRFCAPLCDRLLPEGNGSRLLIAEVERRNLFVVPLDNERRWFRYHHLFQKLLTRHENADRTPEHERRLHHLAGEWFAEEGLIEDALIHLIASGDVDAAATLFGKHLHAAIDKDLSRRTLIRWLNMFPDDVKNEHPVLLVARICYLIYQWDLAGMPPLMDKAAALLRDPAGTIAEPMRRLLLATIDVQRCFYLYWWGDSDGSLRHAQRALAVLAREHRWAYTSGVVYKAGSLAAIGRREEALAFLEDAVAKDCREGSRNVGMILTARMAVQLYAGNLTAVKEAAHQVLKIHDTVPVPAYWLCHAHYFHGSAAYEQNLLGEAADHFGHVEQSIYLINSRVYHECLLGLALVSQARQEPAKALEYADRANSFAIQMNDAVSRQMSEFLDTRLAILSGKESAEPVSLTASDDGNKFWMVNPNLFLAEYLIRKSAPDCRRAFQIIEDALIQAEQHHNTRLAIQSMALKAVALKRAGRRDDALEVLEETLRIAEPLGFVRTFLDRGALMAELLREFQARRPQGRYVRFLLDAFDREKPSGASGIPPTEECRPHITETDDTEALMLLSNREVDVIVMLAERHSNKEISEQLCISLETVKTHACNIYRKLNVNGRRQAVAAAKKRGLLPVK